MAVAMAVVELHLLVAFLARSEGHATQWVLAFRHTQIRYHLFYRDAVSLGTLVYGCAFNAHIPQAIP